MSIFAAPGAYDRAITVFSPDGRLFQVEYALETVNKGATIIGIACAEGVVLGAEEKIESKLQDPEYSWKIFEVDSHLGAAVVGLGSDARVERVLCFGSPVAPASATCRMCASDSGRDACISLNGQETAKTD